MTEEAYAKFAEHLTERLIATMANCSEQTRMDLIHMITDKYCPDCGRGGKDGQCHCTNDE